MSTANLIEEKFTSSVRGTIALFKASLTFVFKSANRLGIKMNFAKILSPTIKVNQRTLETTKIVWLIN